MTDEMNEALELLSGILKTNQVGPVVRSRIIKAVELLNPDIKRASLFDMCLEIFRTRAAANRKDHVVTSYAYDNAADMLEYALRNNYDCLKEFSNGVCEAMKGLPVDEYYYLTMQLQREEEGSDRWKIINDLLNEHQARVGEYIMSCSTSETSVSTWKFYNCMPRGAATLQCYGPLAMVLDIFLMIVDPHIDPNLQPCTDDELCETKCEHEWYRTEAIQRGDWPPQLLVRCTKCGAEYDVIAWEHKFRRTAQTLPSK